MYIMIRPLIMFQLRIVGIRPRAAGGLKAQTGRLDINSSEVPNILPYFHFS